jgi:hypothetical protein
VISYCRIVHEHGQAAEGGHRHIDRLGSRFDVGYVARICLDFIVGAERF